METTMNRTYKGALAAGGAAVLLLGGLGTLAYWSDSQDVTGTGITSGELKLGAPDCGTGWTLDGGTVFTTQLLVPGDVITKTCTLDLVATGVHVAADLSISTADWAAGSATALTDELSASAVFTVGGATTTRVTEADDTGVTDEIEAVIEVTFTGTSATNASQALSATLDTITVSAVQDHDAS